MSRPDNAPGRYGVVVAIVLLAAFRPAWSTTNGVASESANFRLEPAAVGAAGGVAASPESRLTGSLAQAATVGASSSPHFVVQSGFWGFSGSGVVPVVLAASRTPGQPVSVDLAWSGNNASYDVYRATTCAAVFASVFAATSSNAYTDAAPPATGLTCYNVLAVAPGPAPPPPAAP